MYSHRRAKLAIKYLLNSKIFVSRKNDENVILTQLTNFPRQKV